MKVLFSYHIKEMQIEKISIFEKTIASGTKFVNVKDGDKTIKLRVFYTESYFSAVSSLYGGWKIEFAGEMYTVKKGNKTPYLGAYIKMKG